MNTTLHNYSFDFSPKIIRFLGEELIHDKKIAIAELVKNAYDADASRVTITVHKDKLIIEDDGWGMNASTIRDHWLKPGNSEKRGATECTPKYGRLPIGEKGVGRLGVHKLGEKITIFSKKENAKEVEFYIDWRQFTSCDNLRDLQPVQVIENDAPRYFVHSSGTKLIIEDLKEQFEDIDCRKLKNDLLKIIPPFQHTEENNFSINLTFSGETADDKSDIKVEEITDSAMFYFHVKIKKSVIQKFHYRFNSPIEQKIPNRELNLNGIKDVLPNIKKQLAPIAASEAAMHSVDVGEVVFQGYIFDAKYSKLSKPFPHSVSGYLKENGGIRVYRDGLRIYNYGEGGKDNDILNLDRKRAKRIGDNIGFNQILAAIELDLQDSKSLKEKTNREGFIHNESFASLVRDLDYCLEVILHCRKIDRANLEPFLGKEYDKGDVDTKIKKITSNVNKLEISEAEKQKITNQLYQFSNEFSQLKNIFLTAANSGLNLTFIIHEVDKIINHLEEKIKEKDILKIEIIFTYLKNSINLYKDVIRLDKKTSSLSVEDLVKQALFNVEYRFNYHNISFEKDVDSNLTIIGKKGLILGVFTNLFDNAIYWLNYYNGENKKIIIRAYSENDYVLLVIADNGKGFNINFESALLPFISGRTDDSSMGIGLHLAEQIMIAHEGAISLSNWKDEKLPKEFSQGAIIKLKFKKG